MSTDKLRQQEELAVLSSIYSEEWQTVDRESHVYTIEICRKDRLSVKSTRTVILQVSLPSDYPSSSPPVFELCATWMADKAVAMMISHLDAVTRGNVGESVLYQCIECIRDYMDSLPEDKVPDMATAPEENGQLESESSTDDVTVRELQASLEHPVKDSVLQADAKITAENHVECPQIAHGEPLIDRKSTFQAHLAPVTSKSEVEAVLKCLMENRKIASASHNVMAYRIYDRSHSVWYQHCSDDGESAAGGRILHLLQILKAQDVVVIVTRWYGGIHLGPDRFKHYNNCARHLLQACGYLQVKSDDPTKPVHKSKKPKKRK